jgi:hypothetical protein
MATAIGPQNTERDKGIMASAAAAAVSMMGRQRRTADSTMASRHRHRRDVLLDLVDQDHRVTDDHAEQRDDAQVGHEAQRTAQQQQRHGRAGHAQRPGQEHQQAREKLCSCSISSVKMMKIASGRLAAIDASAEPLSAAAPFPDA